MTVQIYKSTDGSAPVLSGVVGGLVALLDACLVTGYGAKAAAGWTKPYTSTNRAVFRMATGSGRTGFYLNVDDNGTTTAKEAYMTGFQTMSAYNTGTGQFPTSGQINIGSAPAGSVVCRKSTTADSTARAWTLVADESCFYLFAETGDFTNPVLTMSFFFGDIFSLAGSADLYKCLIIGRNNTNSALSGPECFDCLNLNMTTTIAGHFMASNSQGIGVSQTCGKVSDIMKAGYLSGVPVASGTGSQGSTTSGFATTYLSSIPFPNPTDGGLLLAPIWITHNNQVRGYMKGLWMPCQYRTANHGDVISGTGAMAGKTLQMIWSLGHASGQAPSDVGAVFVETSNTWS